MDKHWIYKPFVGPWNRHAVLCNWIPLLSDLLEGPCLQCRHNGGGKAVMHCYICSTNKERRKEEKKIRRNARQKKKKKKSPVVTYKFKPLHYSIIEKTTKSFYAIMVSVIDK
jgi:hypothetical protein